MCFVNTNNPRALPDDYDPNLFPKPSVTVDVVGLSIRAGKLCVLLVKRGLRPYEGMWALPGGFVRLEEGLEDAAQRELREETGVAAAAPFLEQLYTFGQPGRDPRDRVISVAYYALLPGEGSGVPPLAEPSAGTDAAEAAWWPLDKLPSPLAFDHEDILQMAIQRVRAKLGYTSVAYALLPNEFTLTELQSVYEIILGRELDKRNFRKKLLSTDLLEGTPRQKRDGAHRPAQLFTFTKREPAFMD